MGMFVRTWILFWARENGFKLHQGKFRLDIGKTAQSGAALAEVAQGGVGSLFLEVIKKRIDVALKDVVTDVVVMS